MNEIFKISINKNNQKQDVTLDNISLDAAESLKLFIDSMTSFFENYSEEERSKVNFSIKKGSLQYITSVDEESVINNDFIEIMKGIENNDFSNLGSIENCSEKLKPLKIIQEKIISNGLDYGVFYQGKNNEYIDISKSIKQHKIKYRASYHRNYEVVFLKGSLYEVGGKNVTNIHILDNEVEYKVDTDRDKAYEFSNFLYKEVYISALKTTTFKSTPEETYELIDKYLSNETFNKFIDLYKSVSIEDLSEKYDRIYKLLYNNYIEDKLGENVKFLKLFNNKSTNRGFLRFLLLSSKNYLNINDSFDKMYYSILSTLNKK